LLLGAQVGRMTSLLIAIANWNGGDFLRATIDSIRANPPHRDFKIVVADNASTDGSVEWLRSQALINPDLTVIEIGRNAGFSFATNRAVETCDSEWVLLLNPDTNVQQGSIDRLIEAAGQDLQIAAVGPRLLNADGSVQPSTWRNPQASWELLLESSGIYKLLPESLRRRLLPAFWSHDERRFVSALSGAAMLIPRRMWIEVGPLDERFHMYFEDDEWCYRARCRGYRLLFEPSSQIVHHGNQSAKNRWDMGERQSAVYESSIEFRRMLPMWQARRLNATSAFVEFALGSGASLTGRASSAVHYRWSKRYLAEVFRGR
jgi:N-acetylglucosaminyl-diphospho-decaprenol L-rhamnosyltransferase